MKIRLDGAGAPPMSHSIVSNEHVEVSAPPVCLSKRTVSASTKIQVNSASGGSALELPLQSPWVGFPTFPDVNTMALASVPIVALRVTFPFVAVVPVTLPRSTTSLPLNVTAHPAYSSEALPGLFSRVAVINTSLVRTTSAEESSISSDDPP